MKNIFTQFKTSIVGILIIAAGFYYELSDLALLSCIATGIVLLFAKDQIPVLLKKASDKFLGKDDDK